MNIKHYIRVKCRIKVNNKILAMRRFFVCLLVGMFSYVTSYGADNLRVPDVRSIGMGGNVGTRSASFNPALLALEEEKSIRLNYFNKYLLKELGTLSGSFYYPNPFLSLGFDISAFGYEAYREMMFRFSMGKRLGNRWALGVSFHYSFLQTEVLESTKARLSVDLGLTYSPFDKLLIGVFMINMPSISLGDKIITLSEDNEWTGTFDNLPVYENGEKITYTVKEITVDGYDVEITSNGENNFTITNTYTPEITSITAKKEWYDFDDRDGLRPDSVEFELYKN